MSAWKQFLASDIIINPFVVNKSFTFTSGTGSGQFAYLGYTSSISGEIIDKNAVGINRFIGRNGDYFLSSSTAYLTGQLTSSLSGSVPSYLADFTQYNQVLIYNSVKQLYYTNFISSSTGDNVAQPVLFPGAGPSGSGDVFIGQVESPLYDNFLQSTLVPNRYFPTASNAEIAVISIPSKIYGEYITPNSFILEYPTLGFTITDDGEGNLNITGSTVTEGYVGNVIYTQGIAILTNESVFQVANLQDCVTDNDVTCSFSSSMTIYETQYKCTIRESEFNATLNPSARDSDGTLNNNVTGSYFSPYVTTVGLYDELQNLLAVGKLAQPLPTSDTTDTTILINLDL
jgi:hypothetical protein